MKKQSLLLVVFVATFAASSFSPLRAQRYVKRHNQKELTINPNYNFSLVGGTVGLKHYFGASAFYGKALFDAAFSNASQDNNTGLSVEGIVAFASYNIGFSVLSAVKTWKVPLDINFSAGVGLGYEDYKQSSVIYEGMDMSKNSFVYGVHMDANVEYKLSTRIGIFATYGFMYLFNSPAKNDYLNNVGLGVSITL